MDVPNNNSRDLHDSILIKILVKLPLKSVFTCKLVCKSWHRLISESSFAQAYTSAEPFKCSLYFGCERLLLHETAREKVETSFNILRHLPTKEQHKILRMVGSCNGLCCFHVHTPWYVGKFATTVYVYNPLTCEYIEIPETGGSEHVCRPMMSIGFGCSSHRNEFKVVRFLSNEVPDSDGSRMLVKGQVFTIGVDSGWREFEDSCIPRSISMYSSFLNGVLHWSGIENSSPGLSRVIYAFNIEEERCRRIQLPPSLRSLENNNLLRRLSIGILNDHLCAVAVGLGDCYFRVWIMKDYGVVESWTNYILLCNPFPRRSLMWFPGFVYKVSSDLFAVNQEDMEYSSIFVGDGEKEQIIHGRSCQYLSVPYVPCFWSLNDVVKGGSHRVRKILRSSGGSHRARKILRKRSRVTLLE